MAKFRPDIPPNTHARRLSRRKDKGMIAWANRVAMEVAEKHGICVLWMIGYGRGDMAVSKARRELELRMRDELVYLDRDRKCRGRRYADRASIEGEPNADRWRPISTAEIGDYLGIDHTAVVRGIKQARAELQRQAKKVKQNGRIESANEGVQAVRQEEEHEALSG
jgi:hypothetical protein